MDLNLSAFDGVLGIFLAIVVIWVALKLVKRVIVGVLAVIALGLIFFFIHYGEFPFT